MHLYLSQYANSLTNSLSIEGNEGIACIPCLKKSESDKKSKAFYEGQNNHQSPNQHHVTSHESHLAKVACTVSGKKKSQLMQDVQCFVDLKSDSIPLYNNGHNF